MRNEQVKVSFSGTVVSVQPRSDVWRYRLDNRTHSMTGYNLFLFGTIDNESEARSFSVAVSEIQQGKLRAHIGDEIKGTAWTEMYPQCEYADYYRAGAMKKVKAAEPIEQKDSPPWTDEVPELSVYDWRGCRMLSKSCWSGRCFTCKWACMANVAIEYNWGAQQKFRFESFCYGPKSCKFYKMGRPRAVPYKGWGSDYDDGWLDDLCTDRRGEDD